MSIKEKGYVKSASNILINNLYGINKTYIYFNHTIIRKLNRNCRIT